MKINRIAAICLLLLCACALVNAQPPIRTEKVNFAAGKSSATIKGSIKGDTAVDYILGAAEGQTMVVTLKPSNASNYFNVMAPGEKEVAFFIGSSEGNTYKGTLPKNGDYTVRVYLMRNAARRGATSNYTITFQITGSPKGK